MESNESGLRCPSCNSAWSEVTKTIKNDNFIRRYRKCMHCGKNWPTTELSHKPKNTKQEVDLDEDLYALGDDFDDL